MDIMTLAKAAEKIRSLQPGEYTVEYTDSTHLSTDTWYPLLKVQLSVSPNQAVAPEAEPFYRLVVITEGMQSNAQNRERDLRTLNDALAQALVGTGILRPALTPEVVDDIFQLTQRKAIFLVPDTNALSTGVLHWLLRALSGTQVWLVPSVISLTQVQQHADRLGRLASEQKPTNLRSAIRSRRLINATLSLLERYQEQYQVLEVDPQLLRYMRPAGRGSGDPDEGDVLEDRLLIEAIHEVFRATRSRAEKRLVTSDVTLARVLRTEGIPTLFMQVPPLPEGAIPCLFYEPLARAFLGGPLSHLLWELTHTFATVRLRDSMDDEILKLQAYWPGKTSIDWSKERLQVHADMRSMASSDAESHIAAVGQYTTAVLPEASFVQVLRIGGSLLQQEGILENLLFRIPEGRRPTPRIARMAAELLVQAGFAKNEGNLLLATAALEQLDHALASGMLDEASRLWEQFLPYNILISSLRERGELDKETFAMIVETPLGSRPSLKACDRLLRVPIYLGQAWTHDGVVRDGTARPQDERMIEAFSRIFSNKAQDGFCRISDLLPELCVALRMSPWAAVAQIQRLIQENRFPDLSFSSAAGSQVTARDQIVRGHLVDIETVPIPMDRLTVGDRPAFMVSRRPS
jgi:hypothetical protein